MQEGDAWEDEDFLKDFEGKGTTLEVQNGDTQSLALKLIQVKKAGTKSE